MGREQLLVRKEGLLLLLMLFSCRNTAIDTAHGNNQVRGEEMNNVRNEPAPCVRRGRSLGLCSVRDSWPHYTPKLPP